MDNLFNSQTVPVTKADIENAGLDSTNCINAQHIRDNSITTEQISRLYQKIPRDNTDTSGCYISTGTGADEVDTSIKVIDMSGVPDGYILHTSDIAHLKTTPFNKLLKNMMNSLLLTIVIAIIICASSFWLNYSNCITVNTKGECKCYIGENKQESAKLIDYLFPSNLWNWPYNECESIQTGGSINYDEKNIGITESSDSKCNATDIEEGTKNNNVFPYSFLRNLEEDYKDYHILKVIPKYSLTIVLCIMLVYRKIVKLIINKGISLNNSLKDNSIGKILIIVLSILSFLLIVGFIHNFIIPGISLLILLVILIKHLWDLNSIIKSNIDGNQSYSKYSSIVFVGAIITGILILIFNLGDIEENDHELFFYIGAYVCYLGSTIYGHLVAGTCLMIIFAIIPVVIININRATAAAELAAATKFYKPIFKKYEPYFKYKINNQNEIDFINEKNQVRDSDKIEILFINKFAPDDYRTEDELNVNPKNIYREKIEGGHDLVKYSNNNSIVSKDKISDDFDTIRKAYVKKADELGVNMNDINLTNK